MTKEFEYKEKADPKDFAPDFTVKKEPYGSPVSEILDILNSELLPGSHILDVAGGYGRYALPLLKAGHSVTIVDIHDASLKEAEHRASTITSDDAKLTLSKYDFLREENDANMPTDFDATICIGFLHHLTPEGGLKTIRSMVNATKPGGLILIEYSCDKVRRQPNGEPILVDGEAEHNLTVSEGKKYLSQAADILGLRKIEMPVKELKIRDDDFWYDANMIMFYARKP